MPTAIVERSPERTLSGRQVLAILLLFFGVVIGVNATLTVFAISTLSGTEVASAYSASLAYSNEIVAAREQEARHWTVMARTRRTADGALEVGLEARDARGEAISAPFSIRLERPVDKRQDHTAALQEVRSGVYAAHLANVAPGRWDLLISAAAEGKALFRSKSRIWLD